LNKVPQSERTHIAFIGKRNVGKSSLVNKFIGQDLVIVSDVPGTTTDPVKKSMELLPFGPVVIIDTAGIDDVGELGKKRINKTIKIISESDFAILVLDSQLELSTDEKKLFKYLSDNRLPFVAVINKSELGINYKLIEQLNSNNINYLTLSCKTGKGIIELKEKIQKLLPSNSGISLMQDLVNKNDVVIMVVPIDTGAPKGRLILPQVQTIRESLDDDAIVLVVKETQLKEALCNLSSKPKLVITDSQAIMKVVKDLPDDVLLTTFSILQARYKGDLTGFIKGLTEVDNLQNGDKVLIAEACSHHAQPDDIGRIKIPNWLKSYTKKNLIIDVSSGNDYPDNLEDYKLIVHCGGCMITRKTIQTRIKKARITNIPIVNYGVLISYIHGAIPRAIEPFPEAIAEWNKIKSQINFKA
jgi:[FeFe] hydrogenase H-cluster maturation GTPase HydF